MPLSPCGGGCVEWANPDMKKYNLAKLEVLILKQLWNIDSELNIKYSYGIWIGN